MDGSRRIDVTPDMPERELRSLWSEAVQEVQRYPGRAITFDFSPGWYAMPYTGPVAYGTGTKVHVKPPGYTVTLTFHERRGLLMSPHRHHGEEAG